MYFQPKMPFVIFGIFISFGAAFSEIQALPEHRAGSTSSKTQFEIILSNRQAFTHLCPMPKIDLTKPLGHVETWETWRFATMGEVCILLSTNFGEHHGTPWISEKKKTQAPWRHQKQKPYQNFSKNLASSTSHPKRKKRELTRPRSSHGLTGPQVVPDSKSNWEAMIGRRHPWPGRPIEVAFLFCQWLFLVPLKGGIGGIVHPPIGRKNTTYIPLIYCLLGGEKCYRSHLLGEPETTIDFEKQKSFVWITKYIPAPSKGCQLNPKGWWIDTP